MKIGDLIIVEWSHNGSYNIWTASHPSAAKLYKTGYYPEELMGAPVERPHMSSDTFSWQRKVASIIRDHTGRWTPQIGWHPR